jgi:hypothetical protein
MFAYLSHTVIVILGTAQKKEVREQCGLASVEIERNIYICIALQKLEEPVL